MICSKIIFLLKVNFYLDREKALTGNTMQTIASNYTSSYIGILLGKINDGDWLFTIVSLKITSVVWYFLSEVQRKRTLPLFMLSDQLPASIKILSWIHWWWAGGNQNILHPSLGWRGFLADLIIGTFMSWYHCPSWHMENLAKSGKAYSRLFLVVGWNKY